MSDCDVQEVLAIGEIKRFDGGGLRQFGWQGKIGKSCEGLNGIEADAGGSSAAGGESEL
jgi:hypothetical protein